MDWNLIEIEMLLPLFLVLTHTVIVLIKFKKLNLLTSHSALASQVSFLVKYSISVWQMWKV